MRMRRFLLIVLFLLLAWIVIDLTYPYKRDIRKFNYGEVARLDGAMWKSYYARQKLRLFGQSAELMRKQFGVPFWTSHVLAYYMARAAFVFKDGHDRADYSKALPYLIRYYEKINSISYISFDARRAAEQELEWWIIRRERTGHPPREWEKFLALNASTVYHLPPERFEVYAHERVQAMLLRDGKGESMTEQDWNEVDHTLERAWKSFAENLHQIKN